MWFQPNQFSCPTITKWPCLFPQLCTPITTAHCWLPPLPTLLGRFPPTRTSGFEMPLISMQKTINMESNESFTPVICLKASYVPWHCYVIHKTLSAWYYHRKTKLVSEQISLSGTYCRGQDLNCRSMDCQQSGWGTSEWQWRGWQGEGWWNWRGRGNWTE